MTNGYVGARRILAFLKEETLSREIEQEVVVGNEVNHARNSLKIGGSQTRSPNYAWHNF